jgi:hypothetical protein
VVRAEAPQAHDTYRLTARLDPRKAEVDARASIRWRNRSHVPLASLFFHLYANAFANERSVFMREQGQKLRGTRLERTGGIDLISLRSADGWDLLPHASTALIEDDATQMRVDLPRPLGPGQAVELEVVFRVRLPSIVARMGAKGDFFMVAQWFPKLAKLEQDGQWASFPYHGQGEFYADFADYELEVELPTGYVLAAPGELVARSVLGDGRCKERYALRNALDVAWAAYPSFRVAHARAAGIQIDVFAPPGHTGLARAQAQLIKQGLARFGKRLGPYPYSRLVLLLPPAGAEGAAGMEYPGLIVGWTASWHTQWNPVARIVHDIVTSHELAHQWFPIMVASNEVQAPVLDEGLAEWLGLHSLRECYGRAFFERAVGLPFDLFEIVRASVASREPVSSLKPAYEYHAEQIANAVYVRPALALESIRRTWGAARLDATLGGYARRQRFQHPGLSELWAAFDRGYFDGFSQQVLRHVLEGKPFPTSGPDPLRHNLLDLNLRGDIRSTAGRTHQSLLARLLLLAQAALAMLGP